MPRCRRRAVGPCPAVSPFAPRPRRRGPKLDGLGVAGVADRLRNRQHPGTPCPPTHRSIRCSAPCFRYPGAEVSVSLLPCWFCIIQQPLPAGRHIPTPFVRGQSLSVVSVRRLPTRGESAHRRSVPHSPQVSGCTQDERRLLRRGASPSGCAGGARAWASPKSRPSSGSSCTACDRPRPTPGQWRASAATPTPTNGQRTAFEPSRCGERDRRMRAPCAACRRRREPGFGKPN